MVVLVHNEEFVDADIVREKPVGPSNRISAEFVFPNGQNRRPLDHRLSHNPGCEARANAVSGQETKQTPGFIHHGKCAEGELFLFDEIQHIADFLIRMDFDRFANQPVDMIFNPRNLGELLLGRHVVMDQSKAAMERKGDRHAGFGDRIHIG